MEGLGKNAEAARANRKEYFERKEYEGRGHGSQRREFFLPDRLGGCTHGRIRADYTMAAAEGSGSV